MSDRDELDEILDKNAEERCCKHGKATPYNAHKKARQAIQAYILDIIDVCRQEYIAETNTEVGKRRNGTQMALHIQVKQKAKLNNQSKGGK